MNLRATEMTRLKLWTTSFSCARLSPLRDLRVTASSVSRSNGGCARMSLINGARSSNSLRSRMALYLPLHPDLHCSHFHTHQSRRGFHTRYPPDTNARTRPPRWGGLLWWSSAHWNL